MNEQPNWEEIQSEIKDLLGKLDNQKDTSLVELILNLLYFCSFVAGVVVIWGWWAILVAVPLYLILERMSYK